MSNPEFKDVQFDVRWRPFFLNASAPMEGRNKLEMYYEKFGRDRVEAMVPMMTQTFKDEGIDYSMGGKTGNTLRSHKLVSMAYEKGGAAMEDKMIEAIFKAYFSQEKDITSIDMLADAAASVGLDRAQAVSRMEDEGAGVEVKKEAEEFRHKHQISGVPYFIFDQGQDGIEFSGAQDSATCEKAIRMVLAKQ